MVNKGQFQKGHRNWNENRIIVTCPTCSMEFETTAGVSGKKYCKPKCYWVSLSGKQPKYTFPKGHKPWNKDKKRPEMSGQKHPLWKGNNVSYVNLHRWVRRHRGSPASCARCGETEKKRYEWANISRLYKRELSDWVSLCVSCHRLADRRNIDLTVYSK